MLLPLDYVMFDEARAAVCRRTSAFTEVHIICSFVTRKLRKDFSMFPENRICSYTEAVLRS